MACTTLPVAIPDELHVAIAAAVWTAWSNDKGGEFGSTSALVGSAALECHLPARAFGWVEAGIVGHRTLLESESGSPVPGTITISKRCLPWSILSAYVLRNPIKTSCVPTAILRVECIR